MRTHKLTTNNRLTVVLAVFILVLLIGGAGIYAVLRQDTNEKQVPSQNTAVAAKVVSQEYSSTIVFMGDTMLGRTVGPAIISGDNPFKYMQPTLDQYDTRVANIESVIADPAVAKQIPGKAYTFNAPLAVLDTLKQVPIEVNVLANNHTSDYGPAAIDNMLSNLDAKNLAHVGAGSTVEQAFAPLVISVPLKSSNTNAPAQSAKVGFIALNDFENRYTDVSASKSGAAYYNTDLLLKSIQSARTQGAELVFAVPHWGTEFKLNNFDIRQQTIGRWLIDNGVDGVIGGHPHVIQPTEIYNGKPIVYSMGNFIFSGMESIANTGRGQLVGFTLTKTITTTGKTVTNQTGLTVSEPRYHFYNLDLNGFPVPE